MPRSLAIAVRLVLFLTLFGRANTQRADVNRWTPVGPDGGVITAIAVGSGTNPTVFAGTLLGVFRSTDGGASWTAATEGPDGEEVSSIVVDPVTASTVYAAAGGSLFKSIDAGAHWASAHLAFYVSQLAIDPSEPSLLYAASGRSIYRSRDGGETWDSVYTADEASSVSAVTALAVSRSRVYAGFVTRRCLIPGFCVPTGGGVLRSASGAGDWQIAGETLPIRALAVDPSNDDTLYAGGGSVFLVGSGAFLRSVDGGARWSAIGPRGEVVSVAVDPREPATVYWGIHDVGVFRSSGGAAPQAPTLPASFWVSVAVEPETGRVWTGSYDGVSTSVSGVDGWVFRSRGIRAADLRAIAVEPASMTVYAGTYGGVFKSSDGGSIWEKRVRGLESRLVQALRIDPTNPSVLYAATDAGVFRSEDRGETWSASGPELSAFVTDVAVDPRSPSLVYAIAPEEGVFRSTNGGRNWSASNDGLTVRQGYSLDVDAVTSTVYVGTYGGVFRSTDNGTTWTALNTGLTTLLVYAVRVAPSDGSTLYASTDQGLFGSNDGGASWRSLHQYGASIAIDPLDADTVYTAAFGEVARSTDGGETWTTATGIPALSISSLAIRPGTSEGPSLVYAATIGGGAYAAAFEAATPCTPDATTLCLQGGRFRVTVDWRTADDRRGEGRAIALTSESGYFWFRTASDVELAVKVVDGSSVNGRFWFFAGSLTGVEFTMRVADTRTGIVQSYTNPLGQVSSFVDTDAFPGRTSPVAGTTRADPLDAVPAPAFEAATCTAAPVALCLEGSRFQVSVRWQTRDGRSAVGQAVPLTSDSGYFWFFDDANVELVVKVLDGRSVNGHFWVFSGALSNVAYAITVTDTERGIVKTYENPQGRLASFADTEAF